MKTELVFVYVSFLFNIPFFYHNLKVQRWQRWKQNPKPNDIYINPIAKRQKKLDFNASCFISSFWFRFQKRVERVQLIWSKTNNEIMITCNWIIWRGVTKSKLILLSSKNKKKKFYSMFSYIYLCWCDIYLKFSFRYAVHLLALKTKRIFHPAKEKEKRKYIIVWQFICAYCFVLFFYYYFFFVDFYFRVFLAQSSLFIVINLNEKKNKMKLASATNDKTTKGTSPRFIHTHTDTFYNVKKFVLIFILAWNVSREWEINRNEPKAIVARASMSGSFCKGKKSRNFRSVTHIRNKSDQLHSFRLLIFDWFFRNIEEEFSDHLMKDVQMS